MKSSKLMKKLKNQFPILSALSKDKSGIAAIEFAFVAPILLGFYFGMSEVAMVITADRNVAHATSVSGDLATQLPSMTGVDISDVMTATVAVMGISAQDLPDLTVELNSYQMMADGTVNRVGYARLGTGITKGGPAIYDPTGLNATMFNAQSGVVVARINHKYNPTTYQFMKNVTLSETFVLKPRKSISVPFDEAGQTDFICSAGSDLRVSCIPS